MLSILRLVLWPISLIYGVGILIRHGLYNSGIFKSKKGKIPSLVIGNLHAGGTGKTPHAEYFIQKLSAHFKLAFLSRGYRRKTDGFQLAGSTTNVKDIGDEPMQIHHKFPDLHLAVCEDRLKGIEELSQRTKAELVILDDAFQHRKLLPDFSIVLMPYDRPWWRDHLLPAGDMRDVTSAAKKANAIVVTKCPDSFKEENMQEFQSKIQPAENQIIAFSSIQYGKPRQIHGKPFNISKQTRIFGFAGIADTADFQRKLEEDFKLTGFRKFADHHNFSRNEIESLQAECGNFADAVPVLMTTEKDAMRLASVDLPENLAIFILPIEISWKAGEEDLMEAILKSFSSSRNRQ